MSQSPTIPQYTPIPAAMPSKTPILHHQSENESECASASTAANDLTHIAPPWNLRGDVYLFSFYTSASSAKTLPPHAYSSLEAASDFSSPDESGKSVGGLGMVQILRYRDSPVGPYDEMLVVPGSFDWECQEPSGKKRKGRHPKITRMYVSQKHTCYNGRINWNCPKHLARFSFTDHKDGSTSIQVYPDGADDASPSSEPFFQATFSPIRYAPYFPFATRWTNYLGFQTTLVMPPLPKGKSDELPGTQRWSTFAPQQYSRRTMLGWFDIAQDKQHAQDNRHTKHSSDPNFDSKSESNGPNFWPGLGRWQLGMKMEDANLRFDVPTVWTAEPKSKL